ncbi:MAG: serpin family protein [Marinobacter sp.]
MEVALNVNGIDEEILNEYYQALLQTMNSYQDDIDLSIKNSIWVKQGEEIKQEFIEEMEFIFDAPIEELDFSKEESVKTINNWIEEVTNGKIKDMLQAPLPPNAIMYLINAIYFNANWQYEFDPERTFEADFITENNESVKVEMMSQKSNIDYFKNDSSQAIKLPYENEDLSMMVFLPKPDISVNDFINNFDRDSFIKTTDNFTEHEDLIVQLPKFKIEYGTKLLNDSLKSLGMEIPFSSQADFSKIREGLMISRVLHKSFIEVNEEGRYRTHQRRSFAYRKRKRLRRTGCQRRLLRWACRQLCRWRDL